MGQTRYPDELRERATRTGVGGAGWPGAGQGRAPQDRRELGVHPGALRTWVKKAQIDQGTRPGTTTDEAQRIKELEKEVRELRRANAIPKSTSACLTRRSVSARPVDLPVHRDQEGGVWGLADLQGASLAPESRSPRARDSRSQDPPPSARSLRDEVLKAEISRVHKNQLLGSGGPQDARDAGPTRDRRASRCRSCGPVHRPCGSCGLWVCAVSDAPSRPERRAGLQRTSARPTLSKGIAARSGQMSCESPPFPVILLVVPGGPGLGQLLWA